MKTVRNLTNCYHLCRQFTESLKANGLPFSQNGFPVFRKEFFLTEKPELIIPYNHRHENGVPSPRKTVLCHFYDDNKNYRRISKVSENLEEYRKFLGVIGTDITITDDMDPDWQRFNLIMNHLYLAYLATHGIKIVLNTRTGSKANLLNTSTIPKHIMCCSSFFGCSKSTPSNFGPYMEKIASLAPSTLLIYGKKDPLIDLALTNLGTDFKYYPDYHTWRKNKHGFKKQLLSRS